MITTDDVKAAHERISPNILNTPLYHSTYLSSLNGGEVYLKLESEQHTGSFKARGALNKMLNATAAEKEKGFITASTGNHAQGFARALSITGNTGTIYLPENAEPSKVEALKFYDVELKFHGIGSLETELHAKKQAEEVGATWISPYNDPAIIHGQATIAKEITDKMRPDSVFGCIGGGGMMAGVSSWLKQHDPTINVVGCLPEKSPEMYISVQQNQIVEVPPQDTLSDGSAGGLEPGSITFEICRDNIDEYHLIQEVEIANAIKFMVHKHHKIVEGAAAVTVASFIKHAASYAGQSVVLIICGANISTDTLKTLI